MIFRNLQNQNSKKVICDNVETVELGVRVGCRGEGRVKGVGVRFTGGVGVRVGGRVRLGLS